MLALRDIWLTGITNKGISCVGSARQSDTLIEMPRLSDTCQAEVSFPNTLCHPGKPALTPPDLRSSQRRTRRAKKHLHLPFFRGVNTRKRPSTADQLATSPEARACFDLKVYLGKQKRAGQFISVSGHRRLRAEGA